jgi:DHA1 family tetracycline resistance protein-like MFS transporter
VLAAGFLAYLAGPALQGIISRQVPANEQGGIQGVLSSLTSLAGILAPPIATGLFGYFVSPAAPFQLPGAPFFAGALMIFAGLLMAARSLKRNGIA